MQFIVKEALLKDNVHNLMRQSGYFFEGKNPDGEMNFARPQRGYPRFHIYLKQSGNDLILNLHLDQKKPSYRGAAAHAGEYVGETVEKEAERIKRLYIC